MWGRTGCESTSARLPSGSGSRVVIAEGDKASARGVAVETATPRFAVFAKEAGSGRLRRLGVRFDNESLVNVFAGPGVPVDEIVYTWASREETAIDGFVRPTEIEIYAGDDLDAVLEEPVTEDDPLEL